MNPLIELNKYPLPAEQVEKLVSPVCSACGQRIVKRELPQSGWRHDEGSDLSLLTRCFGRATPAPNIATAENEATNFALKYVHEQRLPAWVVEHIANAYLFGKLEGIKFARAVSK